MSICYWCYWGWPKPIQDIYNDALEKLEGDDSPLKGGPGHVVWSDENWDLAQHCLDNFDKYGAEDLTDKEKEVVRESLEKLLLVPDEFKNEPDGYDGENPRLFPPPESWGCGMNEFSMEQIKIPKHSTDGDVCEYRFPGIGRLILNTIHGQIIIDVRKYDVNSFVLDKRNGRIDRLLLNQKSKGDIEAEIDETLIG
jgi:hypothetical protein